MPSTQIQSVGKKLLALPLGREAKSFLDYLTVEAGLSDNTILAYGRDLKSFLTFCKSNQIKHLQQVEPTLIRHYMRILTQNRPGSDR